MVAQLWSAPGHYEHIVYSSRGIALSAARQGMHVEAAALVEQGVLQIVGTIKDDSLAYHVVSRPGPKRPELETYMKWLKAAM